MSNYITFKPQSIAAVNYQKLLEIASSTRSVSRVRNECTSATRGMSVSTPQLCDVLSKVAYLEASLGIKAETVTTDLDTFVPTRVRRA